MKDFSTTCGKVGCDKPALYEGYVGNLKVLACIDHVSEVDGVTPVNKPHPIEPTPADFNDAYHHRLECQCKGCKAVQSYEAANKCPRLKPSC